MGLPYNSAIGNNPSQKNQKENITVLDEFVEEKPKKKGKSAGGILSEYANPELWEEEKTAWEKAVAEKYTDS